MIDVNYKVINIPSLDNLLSGVRPIKVKNPDREKFNNDLRISYSLKNFKYLEKNKDDRIECNDVVEVASKSSNKKFNAESIWITVGRNVFDEDYEHSIIGLKADEAKEFEVNGCPVAVRIKSITKKYYGDVSLEDIQKEYPDIKSVDEFLSQEYEKKCKEMLEDRVNKLIIRKVCGKLMHNAEIEFDEESLQQYIKEQFKMAEIVIVPEGIPEEARKFFDITPMESKIRAVENGGTQLDYLMTGAFGLDCKNMPEEEIDKVLREQIKKNLRYRVINKEFAKMVGYEPSRESYDKYLEECAKHARMSAEQYVKASGLSFEYYVLNIINNSSIYFFKDYAYNNLIIK